MNTQPKYLDDATDAALVITPARVHIAAQKLYDRAERNSGVRIVTNRQIENAARDVGLCPYDVRTLYDEHWHISPTGEGRFFVTRYADFEA